MTQALEELWAMPMSAHPRWQMLEPFPIVPRFWTPTENPWVALDLGQGKAGQINDIKPPCSPNHFIIPKFLSPPVGDFYFLSPQSLTCQGSRALVFLEVTLNEFFQASTFP